MVRTLLRGFGRNGEGGIERSTPNSTSPRRSREFAVASAHAPPSEARRGSTSGTAEYSRPCATASGERLRSMSAPHLMGDGRNSEGRFVPDRSKPDRQFAHYKPLH